MELNEVITEREELKNQIQDYCVEVKRAEEVLSAKVGIVSLFHFELAKTCLGGLYRGKYFVLWQRKKGHNIN